MADATLVYDDDCGFCTWWAEFFDDRSDLEIVGFSDLEGKPELRAKLPDEYETCSHLVADGTRYSCGASIEEAWLHTDLGSFARPVVETLRTIGMYGDAREWGYRRFSGNRSFWGRLLSKTPPVRR
ncbi:DUF393 domain-containing protein [Halobacteria archaeon AArc-m2/3/4]|uniref:DUF393 domain-containing protein n=1 Tax=Natronoglomus mannanivorans TaxID=2979990 RepID=A0ABT2Q8S7_9EURY|nr:DUF393 domain-containing protein [Halobacteria archaeon AArc-m2/3/4]